MNSFYRIDMTKDCLDCFALFGFDRWSKVNTAQSIFPFREIIRQIACDPDFAPSISLFRRGHG
jgi:hypothetical protein